MDEIVAMNYDNPSTLGQAIDSYVLRPYKKLNKWTLEYFSHNSHDIPRKLKFMIESGVIWTLLSSSSFLNR